MNTSYEKNINGTNEWLTPLYIINDLGPFDLDPCSPIIRPWNTAKNHYNIIDDGLQKSWKGLVFCNPPYGTEINLWLKKGVEHNNCIFLIFARLDTKFFHELVFKNAISIFFIKGRLKFHDVNGNLKGTAGAASCLIAFGIMADERLKKTNLKGHYIKL
jgi:hypothetical protein